MFACRAELVADTVNGRKRANEEQSPNMKGRMVENDLLQRMLDVRDESGEPLPMSVLQVLSSASGLYRVDIPVPTLNA